jgi:hypothetical protein
MTLTMARVEKYQRWFGWAFLGLFLLLGFLLTPTVYPVPDAPSPDELLGGSPQGFSERLLEGATFLTLFTFFITLIGFVITTGIAWRKQPLESNRWPGLGFILLIPLLALVVYVWFELNRVPMVVGPRMGIEDPAPAPAPFDTALLVAITSMLTAFMSLLGFMITWRKERRESVQASIEVEKKQLELEKLRREIGDKNAAAQEKKKKTSKRRRVV